MKILLVAGRDPWPPRRGDQLRANQILRALGESHRVTVLAPRSAALGTAAAQSAAAQSPAPASPVRVERYRRTFAERGIGLLSAALAGRPLQSGLYVARDLERRLAALAESADLVIVQLARLERVVARLRADVPRVPVVVDLIDALSLGVSSRARVDRLPSRPLLRLEAKRLRRLERRLVRGSAAAMVVAARDRAAIAGADDLLLGRLRVVPLALEPEPDRPSGGGFQAAPRVVLTGNLGYFVNRDATRWALRQLWPRLRAARPEVELVVAGARPAARLRRELAGGGVRLVADPPDLGVVLAGASVALAPMRCGSGTPVKVLEAWAAGVPVVASPYAAAGTEAVAGRELLVAERPDEWVSAILQLLDDPAMAARLSAAGRGLLEREHSLRRVREALATVLDAATGPLC